MRMIRYTHKDDQPRYGWLYEDMVGEIQGSPFGEYLRAEAETPFVDVKLLAPVMPSKIICVGRNYAEHAKELGNEVPEAPLIFFKPPSSVIGPFENIVLPPQSQHVEHEAEMAVVIGKRARWLTMENAMDVVMGYTVANDVTARDLQRRDNQWTRGKGFDTFCPVGPWIETEFEPTEALITCHVNDEIRQMGSTRDMIFTVQQLLVYITSVMTLEPGDLVLTGTPSGVGRLEDKDEVSITIEGLGNLTNPVVLETGSP